MLLLQDLFKLYNIFFETSSIKLVRHKDSRAEYKELLKSRNDLLEYQKEQAKPVFHNCDYIISFLGTERRKSIFIGVFKVNGYSIKPDSKFYYNLSEVPDFKEFENRIIVDWGTNAISWHQWYDNQPKEIIQILPKGYIGDFKGLLDFVLEFDELERLIKHPEANEDWKNQLSAVNGIYLILDKLTGHQYIGSANGNKGIWQRWSDYVDSKHGGNMVLKELCLKNVNYHKNFRFSVLQSLPSNITQTEIIRIEQLYKEKLGTKAFGLNRN